MSKVKKLAIPKRGRPRKGENVREHIGARIDPVVRDYIRQKYGSIQKWITKMEDIEHAAMLQER